LTSYYLLIEVNISAKYYTILPTGIYNHRHATLWEERCVKEKKKEKGKKKAEGRDEITLTHECHIVRWGRRLKTMT